MTAQLPREIEAHLEALAKSVPKTWEASVVRIFRDAITLREQRHESLEAIIGTMHGFILAVDHRWHLTDRGEADAVQARIDSLLFQVAYDRVPILETRI